jgi:hypothetical protein
MSLVAFHRFLIATGILFCLGYAGWEIMLWWVTRAAGSLALGVLFLVLGGGLAFYLSRLNRFLGYEEKEEGRR